MSLFDEVLDAVDRSVGELEPPQPIEALSRPNNPFIPSASEPRNSSSNAKQILSAQQLFLDRQLVGHFDQGAEEYQAVCIWAMGLATEDAGLVQEIWDKWYKNKTIKSVKKKLRKYEGTVQSATYKCALPAMRKLVGDEDGRRRWMSSTEAQREKVFVELLCQDPVAIMCNTFSHFKLVIPFFWIFREDALPSERVWRLLAERRFVALCESIFWFVIARENLEPIDGQLYVYEALRATKLVSTPGGEGLDFRTMPVLCSE